MEVLGEPPAHVDACHERYVGRVGNALKDILCCHRLHLSFRRADVHGPRCAEPLLQAGGVGRDLDPVWHGRPHRCSKTKLISLSKYSLKSPCSVHLLGWEKITPQRIITAQPNHLAAQKRLGGTVPFSGGYGSPITALSFRAGQDYHLERQQTTRASALGHSMGRRIRAGPRPHPDRRDALQQEHLRLPSPRIRR
ncbi:hypothetical protein HMPREF9069_00929 [Atopobium sp. oral taxon 810 str. F0209]|nr:hypothetical protein HMPREF9069_00929 [Atopobium sp. oral taxon 810 str. F0209]